MGFKDSLRHRVLNVKVQVAMKPQLLLQAMKYLKLHNKQIKIPDIL